LPFDELEPMIITEETTSARIYGRERYSVPSYVRVATRDMSLNGFHIPPGGHFEPIDVHAVGDEIYYVTRGVAKVLNPERGVVHTIKPGDTILIPMGVPHQAWNFGDETTEMLVALAPRQWAGSGDEVEVAEIVERGRLKQSPTDEYEASDATAPEPGSDWRTALPANVLDRIGCFPAAGPQARAERRMYVIHREDALQMLHGADSPILVEFLVSNDVFHFGIMTVPRMVRSDPEVHQGEEVIYVLKGKISVEIMAEDWLEGNEPLVRKRFEVHEGQRMLIPRGMLHRYHNLHGQTVEFQFCVAPRL
jgi:gentisate 1,2-dioxygenase